MSTLRSASGSFGSSSRASSSSWPCLYILRLSSVWPSTSLMAALRASCIAALDLQLQAALLQEKLPFFGYDHGRTGDLRSDVVEFRRLGALKGELVLKILRAQRHVLLSDVDVIWLQNPFPFLYRLRRQAA